MYYLPGPTRELTLCLTSHAEEKLHQRVATITGDTDEAIRLALETADCFFSTRSLTFRFWSWDLSLQEEHPVVRFLHEFVQELPADEYWFIRVTEDNTLEEIGQKTQFIHLGVRVIRAPRIAF